MGAHADDAALVEVFGGVFRDVGDVRGELFHTALGLADFEGVFVDVDRGEDVFAHHSFVEHDSVLIVVALPGHEGYLEVASECEFAFFGRVAFGEDVAFLDALALVADGTEVDGCALVGLAEFGEVVFLDAVFE